MTKNPLTLTMRRLRMLSGTQFAGSLGDADLVARVVEQRDEAAFEVLVWRHGPMVLRVCRRVLRHHQDAEDALQATFLVLFRKAHTLSKHQSVGAWLHRIAFRIALRARHNASRRRETIGAVEPAAGSTSPSNDLSELLDQEINRLPERLRRVVVICLLEGRSYSEAAAEIGCPLGTVQSRLGRARQRLQSRLARHGVTASIAGLVSAETCAAALPRNLVAATLEVVAAFHGGGMVATAVANLAQQSMRSLWMAQVGAYCTNGVIAIAIVGLVCWASYASTRLPASRPAPHATAAAGAQPSNQESSVRAALERDLARLDGEWQLTSGSEDGRPMAANAIQATVLTFLPNQRISLGCRRPDDRFELEPQTNPPRIRMTVALPSGEVSNWAGVYEVSDTSLRLSLGNADRPAADFTALEGSGQRLWVFHRPGADAKAAGPSANK